MQKINRKGQKPFHGTVDEFVSSSEQIWSNLALHILLINESFAVNGCRQNESPNSNPHHSSPSVNVL